MSCMKYANELHANLDASGKPALLRRRLEEKLACAEGKSSCTLLNDESFIPATTTLWEAAKDAGLKPELVADVPRPKSASAPAIVAKDWKSLGDKPKRTDGPWLTADGRALLLLTEPEGKSQPTGCEAAKGFSKIVCKAPHADVPAFPQQTVRLVAEPIGPFAAGLVDQGLVAYNLETGKSFGVRGSVGRPIVNGLALEDEVVPEPKAPPTSSKRGKSTEPTAAPPGIVALMLKDGKASAPLKLPTKMPVMKPISLQKYAVWVESVAEATQLVIKTVAGGRLQDAGSFTVPLKGAFHTCEGEGLVGLAVWDRRSGLANAKPTAGSGKTQLTVTQLRNGSWSKPVVSSLPFERLTESELHCTKDGISVAWASRIDDAIEIGRLDCTVDACKESRVKLPGVESKWWWLVSPMGDNVLMVWRSSLGETRFRLAPLASLPTASDTLLFDTSDYGGPANTDARNVVSSEAALMLFTDERPVVLRIGKDGKALVLVP